MIISTLIPVITLSSTALVSAASNFAHSSHAKRGVNGSYISVTAPYVNIFSDVSDDEKTSIFSYLQSQANVTIRGDIQFFEAWLLAPNKTEATAYLDKHGPQPARYARVMGGAVGDTCFVQEYMVGPLPVSNSTTASLLNYVNNGNSTMEFQCHLLDQSTNGTTSVNSTTPVTRRSNLSPRDPHNPYEEMLGWNQEVLPHDDIAAPVAILPSGPRHEFDPTQNYVSWMDFTFLVSTGPAGISLHDIRFKGERIVYELGMQEALAHYAGPDYNQTYASYLDVNVHFNNFNLIPGYDCPAYATYTDAFCLFEYPKDFPMNRHQASAYYHATKNIAFILRSVSTVGNYDYQTNYEFSYDGSIQVIVRASGYIQGSDNVNDVDAWDYGFHIRDQLSGSMHDHVLNFKLDLDIHGTENSLLKTEFVPHSQVYPWSKGKTVNTMKVERSFITNEDQGRINWAPNAAASYAVVNKDKKNDLGEYPGYKVYPSTGASIHLTIQNSTVFSNAVNWATHPLYAVQHKDTEPVSAHPRNGLNPEKPLVDFNTFFNGESLDQEDLVLYFNLGMHHMPDTYDLPNTVFVGAQSGITIRPQNYLRSENSMSTRQQIHITNRNNATVVETYGAKPPAGPFNLDMINPALFPLPDDMEDSDNATFTERRRPVSKLHK